MEEEYPEMNLESAAPSRERCAKIWAAALQKFIYIDVL